MEQDFVVQLGEERVQLSVSYGQYYILAPGTDLSGASTGGTGLVGAQGETAFVVCGTHTGWIELAVQTHDAAPTVDLDPWDDVVEVGLDCPEGELFVVEWGGDGIRFNLASAGPGPYRLRVHARGRDAARNHTEPGEGLVEHHLIMVWPDADESTVIYKATDQVGAYWRFSERGDPSDIASAPSDMAMFAPPPWDVPPPGEAGRRVPSGRVLVQEPRLEITLTGIVVYSTGWMFELSARATREDLDAERWGQVGRIVGQGFVRPNGPGNPPTTHEDGLRLSIAYEGHPAITTARSTGVAPELMPSRAPSLTGYFRGGSFLGDIVYAQHEAWLWPTPPDGPLQLTMQWNALGIAPVTIELDVITSLE